jgi:MerR family transcriptional regulator/heat shock protein HspR
VPEPGSPGPDRPSARRGRPDAAGPSIIDDPTAALFTLGQVAAMLGVQHAFLRRLDSEEVVRPERSAGGQRRYSRDEIDQVERVASLMGEGMTLASIRRIVVLEAEVERLRQELERAQR